MRERFFRKLPAPEDEHRDCGQNYNRLPDADVYEIEKFAVMLAEPDERGHAHQIEDLNCRAAGEQAGQTRAEGGGKREHRCSEHHHRLHAVAAVADVESKVR